MPRIADPNKLIRIREAVKELIVESGYHGVSTKMIAKKAGVALGYMYRHYKSKDEILKSIVDLDFKPKFENFLKLITSDLNVEDKVKSVLKEIFKLEKENSLELCFFFRLYIEYLYGTFKKYSKEVALKLEEKVLKDVSIKTELLNTREFDTTMFVLIMSLVLNRYMNKEVINNIDEEVERTSKLIMAIYYAK